MLARATRVASAKSGALGLAATSQQQRNFRVCVVGAAGGIGQPMSLLLKLNRTGFVSSLALYDVAPVTPGVAADLSHIPTDVKVEGFAGPENLGAALKGADLVIMPAGVPRKPGMTRDDLFNVNANINAQVALECGKVCPRAMYMIISNPVNSLVPVWAEVLKKHGSYMPERLLGVTTLDQFRANTFASEKMGEGVSVPVIGGHAGTTIVPLFSQATPKAVELTDDEREAMTHRVMFGGDEVVKAKAGGGSATLSMAAAGAYCAEQVMRGLLGHKSDKVLAYVESPEHHAALGTEFFATEVEIGTRGVDKIHFTVDKASDFEKKKIAEMTNDLISQIKKGQEFIRNQKSN